MSGNMLNRLLVVFGLLTIESCTPKKQLVISKKAADTAAVNARVESKLDSIKASQLNFNTFSGKAKTSLNINGSCNDVTFNIRISKGQKIWVSVTALAGIEVARALITPDSILAINKLQGLYIRQPFS